MSWPASSAAMRCERADLTPLQSGRARSKQASVSYPVVLHTAIDGRDCRGLAEFYRELLGLHYRQGEEPPTDGRPDGED